MCRLSHTEDCDTEKTKTGGSELACKASCGGSAWVPERVITDSLPAESAACALRNLQLPPGSPFRDPGRSRIDFVMFALHACERQTRRDLPSAGSFCQCVPLQGWLWQSLGAQSSIQVSCLGGSAASIRATLCCFPARVSRKLDWKQSVWRLNWR